MIRTQVGIVGAGPAGLTLSHLLHLAGIESVVLENRDRAYVEARVRAGLLEQGSVDLLVQTGVGERLLRQGLVHHGVNFQLDGERHNIPLTELSGGKSIYIYGQQEVVKDLIAARLAAGGEIHFEVEDVRVAGFEGDDLPGASAPDGDRPVIRFRDAAGDEQELRCDVIAGCDGFHGVCRESVPTGALSAYDREYPFAWLGILAQTPASCDELIYSNTERGFALYSLRSPTLSRIYLQVPRDERIEEWPDDRIWKELQLRLGCEGWTLNEGPLVEKGITQMRSFVAMPMRHGRLFLAGDAAHIVPPTGAKGMNLAITDVKVLAEALVGWYRHGDASGLAAYSDTCLARVWRVQDFSRMMTELFHSLGGGAFDRHVQRARLRYVWTSRAMATVVAENYVGIDQPGAPLDLFTG
jgi:p-hydroxybenzoate 3-monooxygenase